jgi:TRAP transporter TAXI family solute receptor
MKNRLFVIFGFVMILLLVEAQLASPAVAKVNTYRFATMSMGGKSYLVAVPISSVMNAYSKNVKLALDPVGGFLAVFEMIERGEAMIGNAGSIAAVPAFTGTSAWVGHRRPMFRLGFNGPPKYFFLHTTAKTGIKKVEDLRGKKVLGRQPAAPTNVLITKAILEAYGLTDQVEILTFASPAEGRDALIEGIGDAFCMVAGSLMIDIDQAAGWVGIPIAADKVPLITERVPGLIAGKLPKGYLGLLKEDLPVLEFTEMFIFHQNLPEDDAYTLVKAVFDHLDACVKALPALKTMTLEKGCTHLGIPFHAGSIKYFKEKGVWTAEHEKKQKELEKKWLK